MKVFFKRKTASFSRAAVIVEIVNNIHRLFTTFKEQCRMDSRNDQLRMSFPTCRVHKAKQILVSYLQAWHILTKPGNQGDL